MRNEEQRGTRQKRNNKTTKEKRQGSNHHLGSTQTRGPGTTQQFKSIYQDIEESIELATAATLKGFITMKTRPINNSVREWAK